VAEADASNNITKTYIHGSGLLAMETLTGEYHYHFDPTGIAIALTDSNQNVAYSYAYDPFGQILSAGNGLPVLQVHRPVRRHGRTERPLLREGKVL
jgi:hypothetical protein